MAPLIRANASPAAVTTQPSAAAVRPKAHNIVDGAPDRIRVIDQSGRNGASVVQNGHNLSDPIDGTECRPPSHADEDGRTSSEYVDTAILGTGPAALILSFLLHGYQPFLRPGVKHPDPQLQAKLNALAKDGCNSGRQRGASDSSPGSPHDIDSHRPNSLDAGSQSPLNTDSPHSPLLDADFNRLSAHFHASRFSYSTQALPVNTLLDTLLRPLADTAPGVHDSCIEWRKTNHKVNHTLLGAEAVAGGQWQTNPVQASWDIATLSYADQLSLPGWTMAEYMQEHGSTDDKESTDTAFLRPTRRDVAAYLAAWPQRVGIDDALRLGRKVAGVQRTVDGGFYIPSHHLRCRHLVLATGTFTELVPPRELLRPLLRLSAPDNCSPESAIPHAENTFPKSAPLLVVGSGFSAADVILSCLAAGQPVLHLFQWEAANVASPLRACHPSAYPEYASVFRRMRRAAASVAPTASVPSPGFTRRNSVATPDASDALYEGLANTAIHAVNLATDCTADASVLLDRSAGGLVERTVCGLSYVVGRQGSLAFLDPTLRAKVLQSPTSAGIDRPLEAQAGHALVNGKTFRARSEASDTFELAPGIFAIGALLGDSLIRHGYGGCVVVARELLRQPATPPIRARVDAITQINNVPVHADNQLSKHVPHATSPILTPDVFPMHAVPSLARQALHLTPSAAETLAIPLTFGADPWAWQQPVREAAGAQPLVNGHEHLDEERYAILGRGLKEKGVKAY